MINHLFSLDHKSGQSLNVQIKQKIVDMVFKGHFLPGERLPASRQLAKSLDVSRNTVVAVYEGLTEDGFLISKQRLGYFVNSKLQEQFSSCNQQTVEDDPTTDWESVLKIRPSLQPNLNKSNDWKKFKYPFIYGQLDPELFPIAAWRDATRLSTSTLTSKDWLGDDIDNDDKMLVDQLRSKVLRRRGILCQTSEILITLGTQHSLYMLSQLLMDKSTVVGVEDPGYIDVRNIVELSGAKIVPCPVDSSGLIVDDKLNTCDYLFVTPSHQCPTTVTMPIHRRLELLDLAKNNNVVIIEDDYESEINYKGTTTPALKSIDSDDNVIYVGSLSKTLSPGLRLGYMVASPALIKEAKSLRRLMLRHPPRNNQRSLGIFLSCGYHDTLLSRLAKVYRFRHQKITEAVRKYLPQFTISMSSGGSSIWLQGPEGFDSQLLQARAIEQGVYIEPGNVFYSKEPVPSNNFRLAFSAISTEKIEPGVKQLAVVIEQLQQELDQ